MGEIPVIDAFRFFSALFVVVSHAGLPDLAAIGFTAALPSMALKLAGLPFCGIAAVMVFFVVSGFCIHYPAACGRQVMVKWFYLARMTRICLPVLAASLIFRAAGFIDELLLILWSVYCEMFYYFMYPLLRKPIQKAGVEKVFLVSTLLFAGLILISVFSGDGIPGNFAKWGVMRTMVLGLPVWLGGCVLAEWVVKGEMYQGIRKLTSYPLWIWRAGMLLLISTLNLAHFHSPLNYKLTMPLVGILCVPWLYAEIRVAVFPKWVTTLGRACFSIYLMHQLGVKGVAALLPDIHPAIGWLVGLLAAAAASAIFYFLIERPSHQIAKSFSRRQAMALL